METTQNIDLLKNIKEYQKKDINVLFNLYFPSLIRILKNNNHYTHFVQALTNVDHYNSTSAKKNIYDNLFRLVQRHANVVIDYLKAKSISSWAIHNEDGWDIPHSWQTEFYYGEIDDSKKFVVVVYGMIFNILGFSHFNRGFFYKDYLEFKNKMLT